MTASPNAQFAAPALFQESYTLTANGTFSPEIVTYPAKAIVIIIDQVAFTGGTTPQLQLNLNAIFPADDSSFDYYNNGGHGGSFNYIVGPVANNNHSYLPSILQLSATITGAPTNVSFRCTIFQVE